MWPAEALEFYKQNLVDDFGGSLEDQSADRKCGQRTLCS
jgi:hypothetical protein